MGELLAAVEEQDLFHGSLRAYRMAGRLLRRSRWKQPLPGK
jgi:hypothetical protein